MCYSLNLTAASRVHLLEPQWNPSLEDQAMARAHRLGQTRPVTTIRYVMENSFEEVCGSCSPAAIALPNRRG
jgi:SNF2 family DNA or RNA helicase